LFHQSAEVPDTYSYLFQNESSKFGCYFCIILYIALQRMERYTRTPLYDAANPLTTEEGGREMQFLLISKPRDRAAGPE
jgi:hypothetical protein